MGCGGSKDEKKPQEDKKKESANSASPKEKTADVAEAKKERTASPTADAAAGDAPAYSPVEDGAAGTAAPADDDVCRDADADAPAGAGPSALEGQPSGVAAGAAMETMDATPPPSVVQARTAEGVPVVSVVKRRPSRQNRNAGSTPRSSMAPRSAPAAVMPLGNFEDYTPRQAAPVTVQQQAVDENGNPKVDEAGNPVMEEVPVPAPQSDVGGGQLVERKEPVWTVARPPPPTQGWVLLRQVRVVMQMRRLTAI